MFIKACGRIFQCNIYIALWTLILPCWCFSVTLLLPCECTSVTLLLPFGCFSVTFILPMAVSGPVMRHTYQNRGTYCVTVIARNKVSSQTDQARVVVQSLIQGKSHYIVGGGHCLVGRGRCMAGIDMWERGLGGCGIIQIGGKLIFLDCLLSFFKGLLGWKFVDLLLCIMIINDCFIILWGCQIMREGYPQNPWKFNTHFY